MDLEKKMPASERLVKVLFIFLNVLLNTASDHTANVYGATAHEDQPFPQQKKHIYRPNAECILIRFLFV